MNEHIPAGYIAIPYTYNLEFTNVINAGLSGVADLDIDSDADFVVEEEKFTAFLDATQGGAIDGTPAAAASSPTVGNNTFMTDAHFRIEFESPESKWQNEPTCISNLITQGVQNLRLTQRVLQKGKKIKAKLYNDAPTFNIRAQYSFKGYKLKKA